MVKWTVSAQLLCSACDFDVLNYMLVFLSIETGIKCLGVIRT